MGAAPGSIEIIILYKVAAVLGVAFAQTPKPLKSGSRNRELRASGPYLPQSSIKESATCSSGDRSSCLSSSKK